MGTVERVDARAQHTLAHSIEVAGVGLHSGAVVQVALVPAPENTGIVFRRVDLENSVEIPAHVSYVVPTGLATRLEKSGVGISTTEHMLSACAGMGIDNLYIEVDGAELPILDGSAEPFVFLIEAAGIHAQAAPRQWIKIKKAIRVEQKESFAQIAPYAGYKIDFQIDFSHPVIEKSRQKIEFDFAKDSYWHSVARARTFGFLAEYEAIRSRNLARGASLSNTVVIGDDRVLNKEGLRDNAEFVKHKVLDAIGDLALFGRQVLGHFTGYKSGHALNAQLVQAVLSDPTAWELVAQ